MLLGGGSRCALSFKFAAARSTWAVLTHCCHDGQHHQHSCQSSNKTLPCSSYKQNASPFNESFCDRDSKRNEDYNAQYLRELVRKRRRAGGRTFSSGFTVYIRRTLDCTTQPFVYVTANRIRARALALQLLGRQPAFQQTPCQARLGIGLVGACSFRDLLQLPCFDR